MILYFVWKDQKPLTAKSLLKFAIIGIVVSVIASIIYGIIIAAIGASSYSSYYYISDYAARLFLR